MVTKLFDDLPSDIELCVKVLVVRRSTGDSERGLSQYRDHPVKEGVASGLLPSHCLSLLQEQWPLSGTQSILQVSRSILATYPVSDGHLATWLSLWPDFRDLGPPFHPPFPPL